MIEQIVFITIAFVLFMYIFYKLIKKNDTKYVPILAIQALGIGIKFIGVYRGIEETSLASMIATYVLSIMVPILVIIIDKAKGNFAESIDIKKAKFYLLFGNNKAAKKVLIELVTKYQESYLGHKLLAEIYEQEGGQRKAVDEYLQVININEEDYESYYKAASIYTDLDKKDEATQLLSDVLMQKPDYIEATLALGDLLIEKEDYKEAANIYLDALKYNETSFDLNYNLGIVYTMLNDFQSAKMYYEKAAMFNSMIYNTKYSLAEIALIYKELEEAEKYFLEVVDDEELSAEAYLELAKICLIRGEKDQAIQYANVAIQDSPKKIVEKIKKDVTFTPIISKLSIPFNLEIEDEKEKKLTKKELVAKKHLEEMVEITKKIGYGDLNVKKKNKDREEYKKQKNKQKEREE